VSIILYVSRRYFKKMLGSNLFVNAKFLNRNKKNIIKLQRGVSPV